MAGLSEIESEIIKDNVMEVAEDIMGSPEIQVSMEPGSAKRKEIKNVLLLIHSIIFYQK